MLTFWTTKISLHPPRVQSAQLSPAAVLCGAACLPCSLCFPYELRRRSLWYGADGINFRRATSTTTSTAVETCLNLAVNTLWRRAQPMSDGSVCLDRSREGRDETFFQVDTQSYSFSTNVTAHILQADDWWAQLIIHFWIHGNFENGMELCIHLDFILRLRAIYRLIATLKNYSVNFISLRNDRLCSVAVAKPSVKFNTFLFNIK